MELEFLLSPARRQEGENPSEGFSIRRRAGGFLVGPWLVLSLLVLVGAPTFAAAQSTFAARRIALPLLPALKPDGVLHSFGGTMSGLIAASVAAQLYPQSTIRRYPLLLPALGASAALTAGIAKEVLDSTGFGDPQWHDIMHTILGGALATAFIAAGELAFDGRHAATTNETWLYGTVGVAFAVPVGVGFLREIELYLEKRRSVK